MSAYNEVLHPETCAACGHRVERPVQFRYGDSYQHRHAIGERLPSGGNDVGIPGRPHVVVEGFAGRCPHCGDAPDQEDLRG